MFTFPDEFATNCRLFTMKRFLVLFVVFAFALRTSEGARPHFAECSSYRPKEINCSYLFPGSFCLIESLLYNDLPCAKINQTLDGSTLDNSAPALANVHLEAYQYLNHRTFPNLNVSFSNIEFTSVMVKLRVHKPNSTITVCKNFTLQNFKQDLTKPSVLFYDCRWFDKQSELIHFPMTLEYKTTNKIYSQYKKFKFNLPPSGKVDVENTDPKDFQLLIYMENDGQCVKFHWSKPPEKYRALHYRVTLSDLTDNVTMAYNTTETYMSFCAIPKAHNTYNISVEPWLMIEGSYAFGSRSYSVQFWTTDASSTVIVLAVTLVVLFVIGIFVVCWYALQLYSVTRKPQEKKYLLVFEPSCEKHLAVVNQLVLFLRSLPVRVAFAETDIGGNKCPKDWYGKEMSSAEVVLIVSNPCPTSEISTASIYFNVYRSGFVTERLKEICGTNSKRFIKIQLPYCKKDYYEFIETMPSYHLEKHRFKLLQEIVGPHVWLPSFISLPMYSPYFETKGWRSLISAVKEYSQKPDPMIELEIEVECDQSHTSLTSFVSDDEKDTNGVEDRQRILETRLDEGSSDSESEFPAELQRYAEAETSAIGRCSNKNTEDNCSVSEMAMAFLATNQR